ncbi:hypothetical protein ACAN107058_08965 [Paracidovorax anthurii]|uniref:Uncharacterized protein n=1 Tax=Paracidovorax anthurii TaxID=78229 RepID=A0A328ZMI2_9BURK|nr:hypothetical protein [Paracidovorax anthurii]RAR86233.1 hypothetical protein AX018_1002195 [Paracidovorax anthurii]
MTPDNRFQPPKATPCAPTRYRHLFCAHAPCHPQRARHHQRPHGPRPADDRT